MFELIILTAAYIVGRNHGRIRKFIGSVIKDFENKG